MRSATVHSVHRVRTIACAVLLGLGLVLLQILIGGRVLLFALPGFAIIGVAGLCGTTLVKGRRPGPDNSCILATFFFCGYLLLRAAFSPTYYARADLFSIGGALVVYIITATVVTSSRARLVVIATLLVLAIFHVVIGGLQFSRGDNFMPFSFLQRADYGQRASGFLICPNHLAGFLEVVAIFGVALTCWSRWPVWAKLLAGYASGICYVGVGITGSRGGYISVLGSVVFFTALSFAIMRAAFPRQWRRFALAGVTALFCATLVGAALIQQSSYLSGRANNLIDRENVRLTLWTAAVKQWQLEPVVGTGAGTYRYYGRLFRTKEMQHDPVDVHNDYLHLLCEYGAAGVSLFVLFFAAHCRNGRRTLTEILARTRSGESPALSNRMALALGAWSAVGAYVVHSALDFNLHIPANACLLAFVFGIVANPGIATSAAISQPAFAWRVRLAAGLAATLLVFFATWSAGGEYFKEKARTALRDEHPAQAIDFSHRALRIERRDPELFFYLARANLASAHRSDNPEEKRRCYETAVSALIQAQRLAPLDGSYALNLAFTYDEMRMYEAAETMFEAAKRRDPRSSAISQLYKAHLDARGKNLETKGTM